MASYQSSSDAPPSLIGTMGKGQRVLEPDQEAVLYEYTGQGCLSHFWFGGNFPGVEHTRIRYYIDGEDAPSIDMALFMGHGIGFADQYAPWATKYIGKIGRQNGIYNNYRIPFGQHVRVTAQRADSDTNDPQDTPQIWWIIRGNENTRVSLGDMTLPQHARLRLHRLDDHHAQPMQEFDVCNVAGSGALFQVAIAAQSESFSYLEACMRAYTNGSKLPTMLSSGLEDYFLGTYYFDTGIYHSDVAGLTHFDKDNASFSAYRFHDADPVFFTDGLRLTCRCGESEHGDTDSQASYCQPQPTRYTTYTWAYQW